MIDASATVENTFVTTWEDEFGHDMNEECDFSGTVNLNDRTTDTKGATLAEDDGQLYIVDGSTQIAVNDSWIEESSNWGDGYFKSQAIAVEQHGSGDYYQVAVKQENKWTNWSGVEELFENWQVYAVKSDGSIDWEKTVWTDSIVGFESFFDQDLGSDTITGVNTRNLKTADRDKWVIF